MHDSATNSTTPAPSASKIKRAVMAFVASCVLLVAACLAAIVIRPALLLPAATAIGERFGIAIGLDSAEISFSPPSIRVNRLRIKTRGNTFTATVPTLAIQIAPSHIFTKAPLLNALTATAPHISLRMSNSNAKPSTSAWSPPALPAFLPQTVSITDAVIDAKGNEWSFRINDASITKDAARLEASASITATASISSALARKADIAGPMVPAQGASSSPTALAAPPALAQSKASVTAKVSLTVTDLVTPNPAALIRMHSAQLRSTPASFDSAGTVRAERDDDAQWTFDVPSLTFDNIHLAAISATSPPLELNSASLSLTATYAPHTSVLTIQSLAATLPDIVEIGGTCTMTGPHIDYLSLQGLFPAPQMATQHLAPLMPHHLQGMSISGPLPFSVSITKRRKDMPQRIECEATCNDTRIVWKKRGLDSLISGTLHMAAPFPDFAPEETRLSGMFRIRGDYVMPEVALRAIDARLTLGGTLPAPQADMIRLSLPARGISIGKKTLPLGETHLEGGARIEHDTLRIHDLRITENALGSLAGHIAVPLDNPSRQTVRLVSEDASLTAFLDFLFETEAISIRPAITKGTLDIAILADPASTGTTYRFNAEVEDVDFATHDGTALGSGIHGVLTADLAPDDDMAFSFSAILDKGEALFDAVYMNLASMPVTAQIAGHRPAPATLSDVNGNIRVEGLLRAAIQDCDIDDIAGKASFSAKASIHAADLSGIFTTFVQEPFALVIPALAEKSIDGVLDCDISATGSRNGVAVSGTLALDDVDFGAHGIGVSGKGLSLHQPFAYHFGEAPTPPDSISATIQQGTLHCVRLGLPTGDIDNLHLRITLTPSLLTIADAITLPIWSGSLTLSDIRIDAPLSENFRLTCAARLKELDLSTIASSFPLAGNLEGDLGTITATLNEVTASGGIIGTFFGGALTAKGFFIRHPFLDNRVMGIDAVSIRSIDLEPLSHALDIGRITGRLHADLSDFKTAYGQPVAMDLLLRSEKTRGVSQRVSLKAVNSISVIGTGQGLAGVGVGAFASVFKEFGYESIGIRCVLDDDIFSVRGLHRESTVEYLIKKPLFFGINVINRNPKNRISFSDMMERIQRVIRDDNDRAPSTD